MNLSDTQKGALRSFFRSVLFNVVIPAVLVALAVIAAFATNTDWLGQIGVPLPWATLIAAVAGAVARSLLPNVLGPRADAK